MTAAVMILFAFQERAGKGATGNSILLHFRSVLAGLPPHKAEPEMKACMQGVYFGKIPGTE